MLINILSREACAGCRVCCGFDRDDVWEIPVISPETAAYIIDNIDKNAELEPFQDGYRFVMHFTDGEELSYCPMLTDKGCILGDKKPFDCRVWPFRVNCISDGILGITVSPVCETVSALPVSKLSAFLNEKYDERGSLADIMLDYAKKHPYIIKLYIDDYPVLKIVKV